MPPKSSNIDFFCLTGGIATGKSKVAAWLKDHGWTVICTDEIVHRLYGPGQSIPTELAREFGKSILTPEGGVDRKELSKVVFQNETLLRRLNEVVHPKVRTEWMKQLAEARAADQKAVVVIPLAYETQSVREFPKTWVVACSGSEQRRRLQERGFNEIQMHARLSAQLPLQKKIDLADCVIWNDGPCPITEEQLEGVLK
jgi:dephospho-CoA kinase